MQALNESLIETNGSYGESGGRMLRTSLALSAIFKKPVTIHYIRHVRHIKAKRKTPCLRPRRLKSVDGLARGESSFTTQRVTHPLITNLWVLQQFVNLHFSLFGEVGKMGRADICCAYVRAIFGFLG